jgi:undecaprenyl-diphosphatase
MTMDAALFKWINGLAGKAPFLGRIYSGIANDYFLPVIVFLILVALWFGTRNPQRRALNQRAVLITLIAVGIVNALVVITTAFVFRPRPFAVLPPDQVHLFFYKPGDSSFPSNFAALLFAAAIPVFVADRRAGIILLAIALIGSFGRVFIGIHYPFDVLGGAAYGAFASLVAYGLGKLFNPVLSWVLNLTKKFYLA